MDMYDVLRKGRRIGGATVSAEGLMTVVDAACDKPDDRIYRLAAVCGNNQVTLGVALPEGAGLRFKKKYTKNAMRELGFHEPKGFLLILPGEEEAFAVNSGQFTVREEREPEGRFAVEDEVEEYGVKDAEQNLPAPVSEPEPKYTFEPLSRPEYEPLAAEEPETKYAPEPAAAEPEKCRGTLSSEWREFKDPEIFFRESGPRAITDTIRGALARDEDGVTLLAIPIEESKPFEMMPVFCFGEPQDINGLEYLVFKIKNGVLTV